MYGAAVCTVLVCVCLVERGADSDGAASAA